MPNERESWQAKLNHAIELLEQAYDQEVEQNVIDYLIKQIADCERELNVRVNS